MIGSTARSSMTSRSQYRKMSAGNPQYSEMELIATTLVGSAGVASVTFTDNGAWTGYRHLQIRFVARSTASAFNTYTTMKFNGASTGHNDHYMLGQGTTVTSAYENPGSTINYGAIGAANSVANNFGSHIVDILDAFSTAKNKTMRSIGGFIDPNSITVALSSGLWASTAAITSLTIAPGSGSYVAGSRFSLYGIKG